MSTSNLLDNDSRPGSREDLVSEVRQEVMALIQGNPEAYHPNDVQDLNHREWLIRRFLLEHNNNPEDGLKALNYCLLWRKSCGINEIRGQDLPRELYESGIMYLAHDKDETPVFICRMRLYKRTTGSGEFYKKSLNFFLESMDREAHESRFAIIADVSGVSFSNFDIRIATYFFALIRYYFPMGAKYIWVFEPPKIFTPFMNICLKLLPEKYKNLVKIVDKKSVKQLMGPKCVPTFMGGDKCVDFDVPHNVPPLEEVANMYGLSDEDCVTLRDHLSMAKRNK
jgi:hypothetical protein